MNAAKQTTCAIVGCPSDPSEDIDSVSIAISAYSDPSAALSSSADMVVLGPDVNDRTYWLTEATRAGKHALCTPPFSVSYKRTKQLQREFEGNQLRLACLSGAGHWELASWFTRAQTKTGSPTFINMSLAIAKADLRNEAEGILLRHAVPFLTLLGMFGDVDAVYARTRSLSLNRPTEDIAIALIKFAHGLEASVQFNGLGTHRRVNADFYGKRGDAKFELKAAELTMSFGHQISHFASSISGNSSRDTRKGPMFGHFLACWMIQSSRFDRELNRKAVHLD